METAKRQLLWECGLVTGVLLGLLHLLYSFRSVGWIQTYLSAMVAILFLYVPVIVLLKKRRPVDFLDRGWPEYRRSLLWCVGTLAAVFIPYAFIAHYWMLWFYGYHQFSPAGLDPAGGGKFGSFVLYQLLMVALPEEFFFRGYLQSTLNRIWPKRWKILGTWVGPAWLVTALVFAFAHSVVILRWWHFSIFFPALLFGWLREKTGTLTAPILWHAFANIFMDWFVRSYS